MVEKKLGNGCNQVTAAGKRECICERAIWYNDLLLPRIRKRETESALGSFVNN